MEHPKSIQLSKSLKILSNGFLGIWCLIAVFPLLWITLMSLKYPLDAFSANPLVVIFGPGTLSAGASINLFDLLLVILWVVVASLGIKRWQAEKNLGSKNWLYLGISIGWLFAAVVFTELSVALKELLGADFFLMTPLLGMTTEHFQSVWIEQEFYRQFLNSLLVTTGVVSISLTVGTLAGYGLARSGSNWAFWILMTALVFRALPHSVLVSGYLPWFINSAEWLRPIFGEAAPTLYGQPWAIIVVLASINQPFTIWMLRSFFQNIPRELDEAARIDGCSHGEAFVRVIIPVMWPGVLTAGLFSFLLAYNDYLVAALLLDAQNQTMVPAISGYFNRETTSTDQVEAVAAAVSITAPLFVLVMVFQKQLVSGLTQGAVKG
ncbi:MAG TPA: ABC transporter permease [Deltaproteobacteria bacterium]|nr:MAG: carbohydrate ABC transporter permease [Pseudomonadota bacterium]HBM52720.1 ABC transporter permease [Deltaproteobacteria bacterium]